VRVNVFSLRGDAWVGTHRSVGKVRHEPRPIYAVSSCPDGIRPSDTILDLRLYECVCVCVNLRRQPATRNAFKILYVLLWYCIIRICLHHSRSRVLTASVKMYFFFGFSKSKRIFFSSRHLPRNILFFIVVLINIRPARWRYCF